VLEQADEDLVISLVERSHARAKVASFSSSHISGTVLPSFGGWSSVESPRDLRLLALAPCALAPPMRRWRGAVSQARWTSASSRNRSRPLTLSRVSSSCRSSPPSIAAWTCRRSTSTGSHQPTSSRLAASSASPRDARVRAPSAMSSPRNAPPPSSPSSPLMRCPGSGLRRSRFARWLIRAIAPVAAIREHRNASASGQRQRSGVRHRRGPPGVPKLRCSHLTHTKARGGAETWRPERGESGESSGSAGQEVCCAIRGDR
jgi:hypothetical protein